MENTPDNSSNQPSLNDVIASAKIIHNLLKIHKVNVSGFKDLSTDIRIIDGAEAQTWQTWGQRILDVCKFAMNTRLHKDAPNIIPEINKILVFAHAQVNSPEIQDILRLTQGRFDNIQGEGKKDKWSSAPPSAPPTPQKSLGTVTFEKHKTTGDKIKLGIPAPLDDDQGPSKRSGPQSRGSSPFRDRFSGFFDDDGSGKGGGRGGSGGFPWN